MKDSTTGDQDASLSRSKHDLRRLRQALSMAAFGGFSMLAALSLPRLLERWPDRRVMLVGAVLAGAGLIVLAALATVLPIADRPWLLAAAWALIGGGYAAILTPGGRLLRRSAHAEDRPALFAAQFSLSHACWLLMYPLAGWLGTLIAPTIGAAVMAGIVVLAVVVSMRVWPAEDPETLSHRHDDLPANHPHWMAFPGSANHTHAHPYVIDDIHQGWPN